MHTQMTIVTVLILSFGCLTNSMPSVAGEIGQPIPGRRVQRPGLFVPKPKGAGESLDPNAGAKPEALLDQVLTKEGNRLTGRVVNIGKDGVLRLTGGQFAGDVQVRGHSLACVRLHGTEAVCYADEVTLRDGSHLGGTLAAMDHENVALEESALGPVKIPLAAVRMLSLSRGQSVLLESRFASGGLSPWQKKRGEWVLQDSSLVCRSQGDQSLIAAEVKQQEAITFVADVSAMERNGLNCDLTLFCDTLNGTYGRNSLLFMLQRNCHYLYRVREGNTQTIREGNLNGRPQRASIRLAYDPASGKGQAWINAKPLGEFVVPQALKTGTWVMFGTRQRVRVERLRLLRGIVGPTEPVGEEHKTHVVSFANNDHMAAKAITYANDVFAIETEFGTLNTPVNRVRCIVFAKPASATGGAETPATKPEGRGASPEPLQAWIDTHSSRIRLLVYALSADTLSGRSMLLGPVQVKRSRIRRLWFDSKSTASATADAASNAGNGHGMVANGNGIVVVDEVQVEEEEALPWD